MFSPALVGNVFPMIFGRRHPDKLSDGASTPLQLVRLHVEQKVNADFPFIHQIATTMTFKNTHNIILEGAFEFTLPEKATICGYGLDVNGVIVDGVVVEKQAARVIFEAEVRKRIDPGFVELVTGNVFRTRVYPIEPQKTRTVRVIYQDQAFLNNNGFQYQIPIQFQTRLESLDIVLTCCSQTTAKANFLQTASQIGFDNPQFISQSNGLYTAELHLNNVEPSNQSDQMISYVLADSIKPILTAVEKDGNGDVYFAISCALPTEKQQRINQFDIPSKRICILWDGSLSRSDANENRALELNALKKIFDMWLTRYNEIDIILIIFRNDMDEQKQFQLRSDNWNMLLSYLQDLHYDGATNLSQLSSINLTQTIDYYFLFSDCISTMNTDSSMENNIYSSFKAPIWIFNGNYLHEPFDCDFIRYLSQCSQCGGGYLNREKLELNSHELISMLETAQIQYVKTSSNPTLGQIYPQKSVFIPLQVDRFLLVGKIPIPIPNPNSIQLELEFSFNNQYSRLPITLDLSCKEIHSFGLIRRLWAQEKMNELNVFKDKHRSDIISLGLEYSIVSQFTSLLVLETLQQHLQYHVCPAQSRTELYRQYMQYQTTEDKKTKDNLSELIRNWAQTCQWYDRVITETDRHRAYLPNSQPTSLFGSSTVAGPVFFAAPMQPSFAVATSSSAGVMPFSAPTTSPTFTFGSQAASMQSTTTAGFSGFGASSPRSIVTPTSFSFGSSTQSSSTNKTEDTPSIILDSYKPDLQYANRISSSNHPTNAYLTYLNERTSHRQSPSFYFDVASCFFSPTSFVSAIDKFNGKEEKNRIVDQQSITYGLRILTNILELELEAPQLYRTVAYKLMELKQWSLALHVFKKIYALRADEPQSLRDIAIVLIELGQYQEALKYFKNILNQTWDRRFSTIQTIVLIDINRLLVLMNSTTPEINLQLTRHLPVDIRIVVQWDTPDTSIQLSIKEPTGQVCSNNPSFHSQTGIGGSMSSGFSQTNQQPVQYLLRKAIDGIYSISLTYLTNAQHTLTGVTTALIYIYKYFGSANEEKQITTVRLTNYNQTIHVGQIEFGDSNLEKLKLELEKTKAECCRLQNLVITGGQKSSSLITHEKVTCDKCSMSPIIGHRYKCMFCPNLDFCDQCQSSASDLHDINHPLICIRDSSIFTSSVEIYGKDQFIHSNTLCSHCSASPIVGIRYHCITCKVNFCEKCEFLGLHNSVHERLKIIYPK